MREGKKNCPKCGEEVKKIAKVCKHCKANIRTGYGKHPILYTILALFAFPFVFTFLVAVFGGSAVDYQPTGVDLSTVEKAPKIELNAAQPKLELVSIDTRVTESNNVWEKFAWILVVRNNTDNAISFDAEIEWQDDDGFIVDDDLVYNLIVGAKEEKRFTGYGLISADVSHNISSVNAKISR